MKPKLFIQFLLTLVAIFAAVPSFAATGLTYHGRILLPGGAPLEGANVFFHIQVRSPGVENCLLFDEQQTLNMTGSKGLFVLTIGDGTRAAPAVDGGNPIDRIFANKGTITGAPNLTCNIGNSYTPGIADGRKLQVQFNDGSGWQTLPAQNINYVPLAIEATQISGYKKDQLLRVADGTVATELSNANWTELWDLITGASTVYQKADGSNFAPTAAVDFNGQKIIDLADPTLAQDAATKNYSDTKIGGKDIDVSTVTNLAGNGQVLVWDQAQNRWETGLPNDTTKLPLAGGTMTGPINLGAYSVTNVGHVVIADQGTMYLGKFSAGQEAALLLTPLNNTTDRGRTWFNVDTGKMRYWDGLAAQDVATKDYVDTAVAGATDASKLPLAGGTMGGNIVMGGNSITGLAAPAGANDAVRKVYADSNLLGLALAAPGAGEVLKSVRWNAAGNAWEYFTPFTAADLTAGNITTALGYTPVNRAGDTMTGLLLLSADPSNAVGAATKQYVDAVATAAAGAYVRIDGTTSLTADWDLNGLTVGGTRLITGLDTPVAADGAANKAYVDAREAAAVVAANAYTDTEVATAVADGETYADTVSAAAQAAAQTYADGKLVTKDLAVPAAAQDGQSIRWNDTTGDWEYFTASVSTGTVSTVTSANTDIAITNNTTTPELTLNVGTGNNQIVKLNGSAELPAVSGVNLTALNASNIASGTIADARLSANVALTSYVDANILGLPLAAPAGGQVGQAIRWNAAGTAWEYFTAGTGNGSVTTVTSANADIGITNNTTIPELTLNVGTGNNQIVKLNGSAELPAVSGINLTALNASNIASGTLADARLSANVAMTSYVDTAEADAVTAANAYSDGKLVSKDLAVPAVGQDGQSIRWNNTSGDWEYFTASVSTGTVSTVTSANGDATITNNTTTPEITINTGTGNNQIVKLNGSAELPAVSGVNLTALNASNIASGTIADARLSANVALTSYVDAGDLQLVTKDLAIPAVGQDGQSIRWNNTSGDWEYFTAGTGNGTVSTVTSANADIGITNNTTIPELTLNVGTGNNQIVKLNGSAELPAVSGVNLTALNASNIASGTLADARLSANVAMTSYVDGKLVSKDLAVPAAGQDGQSIRWNNTSGDWEYFTAGSGSGTVSTVTSANGDATITNNTTTPEITINTGTGNNQIVKLNGSAELPAVSGVNLTALNASNIASGTIADARLSANVALTSYVDAGDLRLVTKDLAIPAAGQDGQSIRWNNTSGDWEYFTAGTGNGTVSTVTSANADIGITNNTTIPELTLNVGTGNNQIVKLNGSAELPAVSGVNLTNLNGSNLASGTVPDARLSANVALTSYVDTAEADAVTAANAYSDSKLVTKDLAVPAAGQDGQSIRWNNTSGDWEYFTAGSGSGTVSTVTSANGDATITNNTTTPEITINTGTGNNQIVKLNGSGELPAVSGVNLTALNASNIASGTLNDARLSANVAMTSYVDTAEADAVTAANAYSDGKLVSKDLAIPLVGQDGQSIRWNNTSGDWEYFTAGTGNGDALVANPLSQFAATTSAQLASVLNDETGTGLAVFGTSPTFTTNLTSPMIIGGTGAAQSLTYKTTSGVGASGADHIFQVGNNGATEAMRILNSGLVGVGTAAPITTLDVAGSATIGITSPGISFTTLTAPFASGDTVVNVASTANYPSSGLLQISSEVLAYTGKTGTTFTGLTRGLYTTTIPASTAGGQSVKGIIANFAPNATTQYSAAMSIYTNNAVVIGTQESSATLGGKSLTVGYNSRASGSYSFAHGDGSRAVGMNSLASGSSNFANGHYSQAFGNTVTADSFNQATFGAFNMPKGGETAASWITTDPLFVIGNGTGSGASRSTAMMLLKNGNLGVGTTTPTAALHLKAGTAAAGTAPLKLTSGVNLGTPEDGAIEYDGTNLYYTDNTNTRRTLGTSGGITALTGDVTAAGPGSATATIANNAITTVKITDANVTYGKIQNVTTNKLLGRATAGAGVMEEITLGTGLSFTGTTLNASGSGGTVTEVTSANADIGITNTTTTPELTLNVGTGNNQIVKLNGSAELPAVSGVNLTALNASNIASGTVADARLSANVALKSYTDANILGLPLAAPAAGQVGQSIRWNAGNTAWEYYTPTTSIAADSLNFTDFSDTLSLDASTSITAPSGQAYALSVVNEGTGNSFFVGDEAADATPFIIDSSGLVGIGNSSPFARLTITPVEDVSLPKEESAISFTSGIDQSGFTSTSLGYYQNGGTPVSYIQASYSGYNAPFAINPYAGPVGVGTFLPATKLDVAGSLKVGNGGETCGATYAGAIRYNGGSLQYCNGTSWTTVGSAIAADSLNFTDFSDSLALDASTNIEADGAEVLSITNGGTGNSFLVNDATGGDASPFVIDAEGKVGIGTAAPTDYFEIRPPAAAASTNGKGIYIKGQDGSGPANASGGGIYLKAGVAFGGFTNGNFNLDFGDNNTGRFVVDRNTVNTYTTTSGVAFGPTSPMQTLTNNRFNDGNSILYQYNINNSSPVSQYGYNGAISVPGAGAGLAFVWGQATSSTSYAETMRLGGDGKLSIGTSAANELLTVEGVTSLRAVAAPAATANYGKIYVDSGDANKLKYMNPAGSIVDLSAAGTATIADDTLDFAKLIDAMTLDATTSITAPSGQAYALNIVNEGTGNSLFVGDQAADATPFVIAADGRVGIGVPSPSFNLDVAGSVNATGAIRTLSGLVIAANAGSAPYSPTTVPAIGGALQIGNDNTSDLSGSQITMIARNSSSNYQNGYFGVASTVGAGVYSPTIFITQQTGAATYAERFRVDPNGNVGIGAPSSANEKLTVEGVTALRSVVAPSLTANYGKIYVDSGDSNKLKYMNPAGSIVDLSAAGTATIADDTLDFAKFADSMTLDASTSITAPSGQAYSMLISNEGTGNSFRVNDSNGDTTPFVIDAAGNVGIGSSTPADPLVVQAAADGKLLHVLNTGTTGDAYPEMRLSHYKAYAGGGYPVISSYHARGSFASPDTVQSGMTLLSLQGRGYAEAGFGSDRAGAQIDFVAATNWGNTTIRTDMVFKTAGAGSWSNSERMRITDSGNVGIGTDTTPDAKLDIEGTLGLSGSTSGTITFAAPATVTSGTYVWPAAMPGSNMVLQSDNTGALSWVAAGGSGDFKADGSVPMTAPIEASTGTALLPSYTFNGDENTGLYNYVANGVAVVTNGAEKVRFSNAGNIESASGAFAINAATSAANPTFGFTSSSGLGMYRAAADTLAFSTSSGERMRIDSSGNVGIGTTPTAKLDVAATSTITAGTSTGINAYLEVDPTANSTADYRNYFSVGTKAGNIRDINSELAAVNSEALHEGTGAVSTMSGISSSVFKASTGTVGDAYGLYSVIQNGNATGAITNGYGLYVAPFVRTGAITNSYGVYVADTTAKNYFAGDVGIGMNSAGEKLEVNGNVKATSFISTSDARLKRHVATVSGLDAVLLLRGVSWIWKADGVEDAGVIAQEVEKVLPAAVVTSKDGMKAVKYNAIIAQIIEATKDVFAMYQSQQIVLAEQGRKIASVEADVNGLKHDQEDLKAMVQQLESENQMLKSYLCTKDPEAPFCK